VAGVLPPKPIGGFTEHAEINPMSTLGKVLIFLNILAAVAFAGIAAADWGKRQEWSYAVFRQDVALDGLPLDDQEKQPDGTRTVDLLSDATAQDIFRAVGADPVKTQLAEVRRQQGRLRAEIEALPNEADKRAKIGAVLLPLTTTIGDRDKLAAQIQRDPIENLMSDAGPFGQAFAPALDPSIEPAARRKAVAHLLLNLSDPNTTEYQRALAVVGLNAYATEAERQSIALRDMTHRATTALASEAGAFDADYNRILADLRYLADQLTDRQAKFNEHQDLATRQNALLTRRQADVTELRQQIEQTRQAVAAEQAKLAAEQQRLFEVQRAVATGVAKNLELEQQIRQQEGPKSEGK
jgi:hypothetical protein